MGRPSAESFTRLLVMTMALSSSGIVAWPVVSRTAALQLPTVPVRAGEVGRSLSQQDIAALQQTLPAGAMPWLLIGERGQAANAQLVEVYLAPTVATSQVRRGPVIPLRRLVRSPAPPESWTIVDNYMGAGNKLTYAQVGIPGRTFDEIQGDEDANRPFLIIGTFDDADLAGIVALLRADTGRTAYPGGGSIRGLPILRMTRRSDTSVVVYLRDGGILRQQQVSLDKREGAWIIVSVVTGRA